MSSASRRYSTWHVNSPLRSLSGQWAVISISDRASSQHDQRTELFLFPRKMHCLNLTIGARLRRWFGLVAARCFHFVTVAWSSYNFVLHKKCGPAWRGTRGKRYLRTLVALSARANQYSLKMQNHVARSEDASYLILWQQYSTSKLFLHPVHNFLAPLQTLGKQYIDTIPTG